MDKKQKLELTWIGKDQELKIEPRILIEDPKKSNGDPKSENMLIHGDNLLALKALEQDYSGKIKCIYIDPPYNTGSAFEHYNDALEHSIWLSLMKPRLVILNKLLSEDGVIYINIDVRELAYLKILCDEVFGRGNFLSQINTKAKASGGVGQESFLFDLCEYILVYCKDQAKAINKMPQRIVELVPDMVDHNYSKLFLSEGNVKKDSEITTGVVGNVSVNIHSDFDVKTLSSKERTIGNIALHYDHLFRTTNPQGGLMKKVLETIPKKGLVSIDYTPSKGRNGGKKVRSYFLNGGLVVWFKDSAKLKDGKVYKYFKNDNLWLDNLHQGIANEGGVEFPQSKKPERLVAKMLEMSSEKGDFVMDSFLGSGTTAAVAHKMGRKWIGVEMGEHADTHCRARLNSVVDGTDQSGISKTIEWRGGGGYRFYELAPSLLKKDSFGNFVIEEKYNANQLAEAMCKHEGFRYFPDDNFYWKQGRSTETDFIFTTTSFVTVEQLNKIHEEMKDGESLLVCTKAFAPECENKFSNITVKKIPKIILGKCEFGKDNYDLNIIKATEQAAEDEE